MPHQQVNFEDLLHQFYLKKARGVTLSAYLVALAAYQRGLKVVFHYDLVHKSDRFKHLAIQGYRCELMNISDHEKSVYFYRALSETVDFNQSMMCEDKQATKETWIQSEIPVPNGLTITKDNMHSVLAFLEDTSHKSYILKPLRGSLAKNVSRGLSKDEAIEKIKSLPNEPYLLEEEIIGREYRVYVLDGNVIDVSERLAAFVIGDGRQTIFQLIERRNLSRKNHPFLREFVVDCNDLTVTLLEKNNLSINYTPKINEKIFISDIKSHGAGGTMQKIDNLPSNIIDLCIKAQQACQVSLVGLDLIVANQGKGDERVVFLEANQNPHIRSTILSPDNISYGNTIAEHLIDYHFPNTINNKRHIEAAFDIEAIEIAFKSGSIDEVALPTLNNTTVTKRFVLDDEISATRVKTVAKIMGIHAVSHSLSDGRNLLSITTDSVRFQQLTSKLNVKIR